MRRGLATWPTNEVTTAEERWLRRSAGREGVATRRAVEEEDAALGESEVAGERRGGERKNRRKGVNDKLAPHVRGDIEGEILSFR